jgi:hypothetical protein
MLNKKTNNFSHQSLSVEDNMSSVTESSRTLCNQSVHCRVHNNWNLFWTRWISLHCLSECYPCIYAFGCQAISILQIPQIKFFTYFSSLPYMKAMLPPISPYLFDRNKRTRTNWKLSFRSKRHHLRWNNTLGISQVRGRNVKNQDTSLVFMPHVKTVHKTKHSVNCYYFCLPKSQPLILTLITVFFKHRF